MPSVSVMIAVMLGGALGSLLRFLVSYVLSVSYKAPAYIPTLLVNLLGSFAIGCCYAIFSTRGELNEVTKLFIMTGLLGGLTTFSTFSLDAVKLLENGSLVSALIYIVLSLLGGLVAAWVGIFLIRTIG